MAAQLPGQTSAARGRREHESASPKQGRPFTDLPFTDDRVRHVCSCGWEGRWDESFVHIVAERDHRIVSDYLPKARARTL